MPMQITSEKLYLAKRKRNEAEKQNIFHRNDWFFLQKILDSKYPVLENMKF